MGLSDASDPQDLPSLIKPGGKIDEAALRQRIATSDSDEGDDAELRRVRFELQRDLKEQRLDRYLTTRIDFLSRSKLQKLIEDGGVLVNTQACKPSTKLRAGDVVEVVVPPPPDRGTTPEDIPLDVLYEDEHLIVLNKQADIIVHPARSENTGTMTNALAYHFLHRSQTGGALSTVGDEFARPGVVHRLDRDTTGCIVFAKHDETHWKLGHQFEHRQVDKRYVAFVQGRVEPDVDVIEFPIGPHPSKQKGYREKQVVRHDELGKNAVTICRVLERYRSHSRAVDDQWFSLVELELRTGRTHQIRVHLSHLGWPIVGDDMYGGRAFAFGKDDTFSRQALHAALLGFMHPIAQERTKFVAPLPDDIMQLMRTFRTFDVVERVNAAGSWIDPDQLIAS
ncbi:MAG: RluA family pseudouridine synthase [Phycisphaeraceae bacterium]|nr:RluA family pseudouridine synthase [Phycisphaerales bacterium]MCB9860727.1 RluA family pseudouridine synthase [Phycisphaeraceae bacterium]